MKIDAQEPEHGLCFAAVVLLGMLAGVCVLAFVIPQWLR